MRLPKSWPESGLIRLTFGPMLFHEARRLADEPAGVVWKLLRIIETRMEDDGKPINPAHLFGAAGDEEDQLSVKFITMLMKSALYDIQQPDAPATAQEARGHELIRQLMSISNEQKARQEGRPHNSIVADHAELLASTYAQDWVKELNGERQPSASETQRVEPVAAPPSQPLSVDMAVSAPIVSTNPLDLRPEMSLARMDEAMPAPILAPELAKIVIAEPKPVRDEHLAGEALTAPDLFHPEGSPRVGT